MDLIVIISHTVSGLCVQRDDKLDEVIIPDANDCLDTH